MNQILLFTILALATYSVTAADVCAGQKKGKHLPHANCGNFYVCDEFEVGNVRECSPGLHFSPKKHYCLPPHLAGCEDNTDPTPSPPTPGPPGPTTTPGPGPSGECKGQPLGKRIPYPKVCEKFIVCIGGGVVQDCPPPLHFSAELEVCDWPERANCPWW